MTEFKTPYDNVAFLLFLSHWNLLKELTPEEFMRVVQGIFSCAGADCDMPEDMNRMERTVFNAISGDVLRALDNYEETRNARAEAGRKGGYKKAENAKKAKADSGKAGNATNSLANLANLANDNATATATETDKVSVSDNASSARCAEGAPDGACAADAAPHAHAASQKSAKSSLSDAEAAHFEALWKLYPLKRGKNKVSSDTRKALTAVSVEEMGQAIERYKEEVKAAPADRQLLHGSTWFNGRYEDYLDANYEPAPQIAGTKQPPKTSTRAQQLDAGYAPGEKESREEYLAKREE